MLGQLSKDVNFRLITSGGIGPKETTNLIRLLEAQREIMTEFDDIKEEAVHEHPPETHNRTAHVIAIRSRCRTMHLSQVAVAKRYQGS